MNFLIRKFIRNWEQTSDPTVRKAYGTLSSVVGMLCNIVLFALKYSVGVLSNSIAIISDAFNNLSDCASCLVTLFGYKLAAKPADKDHPFGHGRMEYLTSLVIAVMIALMGFELLRNSAEKILHPEQVAFHAATLVTLLASVGVKLWMAWFNARLGRRIDSAVMIATAKDSRSDVAATAATILAGFPIALPIAWILISGMFLKLHASRHCFFVFSDALSSSITSFAVPDLTAFSTEKSPEAILPAFIAKPIELLSFALVVVKAAHPSLLFADEFGKSGTASRFSSAEFCGSVFECSTCAASLSKTSGSIF